MEIEFFKWFKSNFKSFSMNKQKSIECTYLLYYSLELKKKRKQTKYLKNIIEETKLK